MQESHDKVFNRVIRATLIRKLKYKQKLEDARELAKYISRRKCFWKERQIEQ